MKKVEFNIATREGFENVKGYQFNCKETNRRLIVHKERNNPKWKISDYETGLAFPYMFSGLTRKDALHNYNIEIERFKDKYLQSVKSFNIINF